MERRRAEFAAELAADLGAGSGCGSAALLWLLAASAVLAAATVAP